MAHDDHKGATMYKSKFVFTLIAAAAAVAGMASSAAAEGALAVGSTSNVSRDGVAFGTAVRYDSNTAASTEALSKCHSYASAPKAAAQCRLVGTFKGECWAIAMDPKPGTPGAGWAIASDKATAEQRALDNCKVTAGSDRVNACKADSSDCDDK
ncbi:MAG TPA: DUF4189 domain-containing protein [Xanthobacteraceae bacterium]